MEEKEIKTSLEPMKDELIVIDQVVEKEPEDSRKKHHPKRRKRGFHEKMFSETSYYFKDGLQFVFPYYFAFTAHVKGRWLNMKILDLFRKEFHMETVEYYEKAIETGKIKVNDQLVSRERVLKNNDIVSTMVHRHEPPVIHQTIEFLQNDDDLVVINKPSSIPVHPCGRYRHNTIVFILGKQYNLNGLLTIHRIDRLTSGILMFAKTAAKAREMEQQMHQKKGKVEKEYFARVVGEFPSGEIDVNEPILTASHKIGVCQVHPDGKLCSTKFKLIKYNGKSSLVSCKPETGRMHQIRVHLQYLGHPIINDPIYNHPTAWLKNNGKYNIDEVIQELIRTRSDKTYNGDLKTDKLDLKEIQINSESINEGNVLCHKKRKVEETDSQYCDNGTETLTGNDSNTSEFYQPQFSDVNPLTVSSTFVEEADAGKKLSSGDDHTYYTSSDIGEQYVDEDCIDCKRKWKIPSDSELVMYLHSFHYKGSGFEYKTSIPIWATEDWNVC